MNEIFADSFFFIALLNPSDQHHAAAVAASSGLTAPLVTTEPVLIELADALSAPANRSRAAAFCAGLAGNPASASSRSTRPASAAAWNSIPGGRTRTGP